MDALKPVLLRWVTRVLLATVILGVVLTLTLSGVLRLLDAFQTSLTSHLGESGALVATALLCLTPLLVTFGILWRWQRRFRATLPDSSNSALRELVRNNPWEAVGTAFVFGFSYKSDPQLSALLLRESLQKLNRSATADD